MSNASIPLILCWILFHEMWCGQLATPLLVPTISSHSCLSEQDTGAGREEYCHDLSLLARKALVFRLSEDGNQHQETAYQKGFGGGFKIRPTSSKPADFETSHGYSFWKEWGSWSSSFKWNKVPYGGKMEKKDRASIWNHLDTVASLVKRAWNITVCP